MSSVDWIMYNIFDKEIKYLELVLLKADPDNKEYQTTLNYLKSRCLSLQG